MIQAVPASKTPSVPTAGRGVPSLRKFALALAVAPDGGDDTQSDDADATLAATDGKARQDGADDGTDLPTAAPIDPRLAWLGLPVVMPAETPTQPPTPSGTTTGQIATDVIATGANGAAPAPVLGIPTPPPPTMPLSDAATSTVVTPSAAQAATAPPAIATAVAATPPQAPATTDKPVATDASAALAGPLPIALPDPARPAPPTPALQAFADAMHAGLKADAAPARKDASDPLAAPGPTTAAPMETVRHAVAATGGMQEQTLDTRREHWPQTMIDHIEALRDSADATSSKIRVVPDALGTIDLSVKRDGDTLHVHFSAEQAATRTMLVDAQPRLAEIAQTRGLRLGDTNVGGGGGGAPQQRAPVPVMPLAPTPAPARAPSAAGVTDTRIA